MALSDRLIKVQHGSFSPGGGESPYAALAFLKRLGSAALAAREGDAALTEVSAFKIKVSLLRPVGRARKEREASRAAGRRPAALSWLSSF